MVVSTAIDKYIYLTVNPRFDGIIRVSYSRTELVDRIDAIKHNIIREALRFLDIKVNGGIDIVYMSDLPPASVGTGLGASSAIAVGILQALHAYRGEHISPERLAQEACRLEIGVLKCPIGKQDQYAVSHGGFNRILFHQDDSVRIDPLVLTQEKLNEFCGKLLLFYTGLPSRSEMVLKEQKKKTKANMAVLDKMVALAQELESALHEGRIGRVGEILHENWVYKKQLSSGVSNDFIDSYYEKGIRAGATGGKILGSGGGGFLLFYCEENKQQKLRRAIRDLREMKFDFEPNGSRILYFSH